MGTYIYFQPNPNETGDCVVRSICKATGHGWFFVYDRLVELGRNIQDIPTEPSCFSRYLESNGFKYHVCTVKKVADGKLYRRFVHGIRRVHIS